MGGKLRSSRDGKLEIDLYALDARESLVKANLRLIQM